jgi:flagellin
MAAFINTNVASLNAQRNLTTSQSSLATSLQRLSSGLRINSAKDDAAGLAISERFSSQIRGVNQAIRNANDGISLGQTAEGAMGELGNNIQRIRELAVQASNATNTTSDRASIQKEVAQLKSEIDRVANQTEFNGTKLLDGTFSGKAFQVGANAGQSITINNIVNAQTSSLAQNDFVVDSKTAAITAGNKLTGTTINTISIADVDTTGMTASDASAAIQNAINAKADQTGVYAEITATNEINLVSTKANKDLTVTGTGVLAPALNKTIAADKETTPSGLDVTSFKSAQRSINLADDALSTINSARADLGAIQNRFQSTIANLSSTSENMSAARGRIQDADFAAETASMTRSQILQQAGTAMLAQANSLPNGVLALLRG